MVKLRHCIALIVQDGRNLGGWEPESWQFLEFDQQTGLVYKLRDVFKLQTDFANGLFKPFLTFAEQSSAND